MNSVLIELVLPPRQLSPNARVHWAAKAKKTKQYRQHAYFMTVAGGGKDLEWGKAVAQATFYWPNHCRRDIRNAEHSLKAAYDGIVDAGLIIDDNADVLGHEETVFAVDAVNPRVVIRVTRRGSVTDPSRSKRDSVTRMSRSKRDKNVTGVAHAVTKKRDQIREEKRRGEERGEVSGRRSNNIYGKNSELILKTTQSFGGGLNAATRFGRRVAHTQATSLIPATALHQTRSRCFCATLCIARGRSGRQARQRTGRAAQRVLPRRDDEIRATGSIGKIDRLSFARGDYDRTQN